ncbi:MAG: hypothetical protein GXP28_07705, partial [Planctomycetes bacterium]|nr:hypothetical protein [Planctomycetota bacterium]
LGYPVQLFERGESAAANVLAWGHVNLFTPTRMNISPLGVAALQAQDPKWQYPIPESTLSGLEYFDCYWKLLAESDLVAGVLECNTEIVAIGRQGWLKKEGVGNEQRGEAPFTLLLRDADGSERNAIADVVIDCTGTYGNHNWLGQGGIPALGETAAARQIEYGLPDLLGLNHERYLGKHTLVVGAGYSAATVVAQLSHFAMEQQTPGIQITWITRGEAAAPIRHIAHDRLLPRDELAKQANALAAGEDASVTHHRATTVAAVEYRDETDDFEVELTGGQNGNFVFDRIIANVGYRPDNQIYSELQVHECYASGGPMKLAAQLTSSIGNGSADCLDQASYGPASLLNPEPNFYILGSKSYGRNTQFLLSIGFQQIRDLFSIVGEREDLDLYATMPKVEA